MRRYLQGIIHDGFSSWEEYRGSETFRKNCKKVFLCKGREKVCRGLNTNGNCTLCINCQCPHYKTKPYIMMVIK